MQFDGGDELRQALDRSHLLHQQAQALQERLAEIQGEGTGAEGYVRLTVEPGGAIRDLYLNPRVMRMASEDLADAIRQAHRSAAEDLQAKVNEATMDLLGPGIAGLLSGEKSVEDVFGAMRATAEETLDRSLAEIDRLRRNLSG